MQNSVTYQKLVNYPSLPDGEEGASYEYLRHLGKRF